MVSLTYFTKGEMPCQFRGGTTRWIAAMDIRQTLPLA